MSTYKACTKLFKTGLLPHDVADALGLPHNEVLEHFATWQDRQAEKKFQKKKLIGHPEDKEHLLNASLANNDLRGRTNLWIHEAFRGGETREAGGGLTKLYEPLTARGGRFVSHFYAGNGVGDVRVTMPRDVAALDVVRAVTDDSQAGFNIVDIDPFGSLMLAHAIFGGALRLFSGKGGILFVTFCTGTNHLRNPKVAAAVAGFYGTDRPEPIDQMVFVTEAADKVGRELVFTDYKEMSRNTFRAVYTVKPAILPPVVKATAMKRLTTLLGS